MENFGSQAKSITIDHGKGFADYQTIEQGYQIKVYFCHHIHHGNGAPMNISIEDYVVSSRKIRTLAK